MKRIVAGQHVVYVAIAGKMGQAVSETTREHERMEAALQAHVRKSWRHIISERVRLHHGPTHWGIESAASRHAVY